MTVDLAGVVGAELKAASYSWSADDIILYALGVGAGVPPEDPEELKYVYEADLQAVPTFGTIPPFGMIMGMASTGLEIDLSRVLHGNHQLTVNAAIPVAGSVTQVGRVVEVFDKGRGALVVIEVRSTLAATGELLFTNRAGIYVRGAGGFGGDSGPSAANSPPRRSPDHVVVTPTMPQQALLYRMSSGDRNPLHADPEFASRAGFDRPILHGLCTYGVVAKQVIQSSLKGRPQDFASFEARFTGHVFPGETLITRIWDQGESHIVETTTEERGKTVLANARVTVRE